MRAIILFSIFLFESTFCFSQKENDKLLGKWEEKAINGEKIIECPNEIVFEKNSKYKIFNVCYGFDSKSPITEDGTWAYDYNKKAILLQNRNKHENELIYEPTSQLTIHIKELKTESIMIFLENGKREVFLIKK